MCWSPTYADIACLGDLEEVVRGAAQAGECRADEELGSVEVGCGDGHGGGLSVGDGAWRAGGSVAGACVGADRLFVLG